MKLSGRDLNVGLQLKPRKLAPLGLGLTNLLGRYTIEV